MVATGLRLTLAAAAAAVVLALLWWLPEWHTAPWRATLTPHEELALQSQLRLTLAVLLASVALLVALALSWRRAAAGERTAQAALAHQVAAARGERFTHAVGQLADGRLEVRLGALYALEQLAAEGGALRIPAREVLCAFVRERAAWDAARPPAPRLPADVQAALSVLGRRPPADGEPRLDLRRTDLRGADLNGVLLARAILREAHLDHASLQGAQLAGADLRGASLCDADLVAADLRGADLREAHLERAYLVEARLDGADLGGAHLPGAYLGGASLQGADLGGAHLDGAYLYKANLEGASLHGARVMSTIGVHRDERERLTRALAGEDEGLPPTGAVGRRAEEPLPSAPPPRPTPLRRMRR